MKHPVVIGSDAITSTKRISLISDYPPLPKEYLGACITWKLEFLQLPRKYGYRKRFHQQ